jgi:REP element-mobilizing transposase RayT
MRPAVDVESDAGDEAGALQRRKRPRAFRRDGGSRDPRTSARVPRAEGVAMWSYCLMPNHMHLIVTPNTSEKLARALGNSHRRYSSCINARPRVPGHLFQGASPPSS